MDLQTRKIEFVQKFLKLENEDLIAILENVLVQKTVANSNMSITELNTRINKSEEDFKNGRYKTSAQLIGKYK